MSFGKRIKKLREEKGLTQEELGKIVNLSKGNISKYEKDLVEANNETLKMFADYFNVSLDYLLGRSDIRNTNETNLTPNENKDIEDVIKELKVKLLNTKDLKFDGKPATKDDIEAILDSVKVGMEMAKMKKRRNK